MNSRNNCIRDLIRVTWENPSITVSNGYYQYHGLVPRSQWKHHFDRFSDFRKAAGLKGTRAETDLDIWLRLMVIEVLTGK